MKGLSGRDQCTYLTDYDDFHFLKRAGIEGVEYESRRRIDGFGSIDLLLKECVKRGKFAGRKALLKNVKPSLIDEKISQLRERLTFACVTVGMDGYTHVSKTNNI